MKLWDVVEFDNKENFLLYKHECENFNTNTKIIVREGQTAVFVKNGRVYDSFLPGRYTLKTENIPLLSRFIRSITTAGEFSYTAEIYFISTVDQMNIKWGTRNPMDLQDPNYKVVVKVGACGESTFSIIDPINFIRKIAGTNKKIEHSQLSEYFRSIINTYVKNCISDALIVNKISILEINSCLIRLSNVCCEYLNTKISEYGIHAKNFTIETINIAQDDPSLIKLKSIFEEKASMDILGYNYQEKRSFDVAEKAAATSGNITNSLMGIGLGFGLMNPIAKETSAIINEVQKEKKKEKIINSAWICPNCGKKDIESKFCPDCGVQKPTDGWTCVCGTKNIQTNFCPNCGKGKQE